MALSYIVPQVRIFQQHASLPVSVTQNQNAFVFGNSYVLYRYANENIRNLIRVDGGEGVKASVAYAYPQGVGDGVDTEYVKVFVKNASIKYPGNLTLSEEVGSSDTDFKIKITADSGTLPAIKVGDVVYDTVAGAEWAYIVGVERFSDSIYVTLDRPLTPSGSSVVAYVASLSQPTSLTITDTDVTISALTVGSTQYIPGTGEVYIEYRVANNGATGDVYQVNSLDEILTEVGADIHPDDPLTYGVYLAFLNSGNQGVYYTAVEGDNWANAVSILRNIAGPYSIVPLTMDSGVHDLVKASIDETSTASMKRWRIAFLGTEKPEFKYIFDELDDIEVKIAVEEADYTATFTLPTQTSLWSLIKPGDVLEEKDNQSDRMKVVKVLSATTVSLEPIAGSIAFNDGYSFKALVYRTATRSDKAQIVQDVSMGMHSKRLYHVFAGENINGTLPTGGYAAIDNTFVAAAVAGLCSSVPPQQGLTNISLTGIYSAVDMYRTFSASDLDTMAAGGTLLVAQDTRGGDVYVRHQLSTARQDNNLNTTELSLVKNLDSISYYFADRFSDMIGVTNVTPEILILIRARLEDGILFLTGSTGLTSTQTGGVPLGPQVIAERTQINYVEVDPVMADTVNADLDLNLPKPFNVFNLVLRAV